MHPSDKLTATPAAIELGILHACCLREENLSVAEWVSHHKMVRVCRHCRAKHYTMRAIGGHLDLGLNRPSSVRTEKGRRHFSMGLEAGRINTQRRGG